MSINVTRSWQEVTLKASLQPLRDSFLLFITDQDKFGIGSIVAGVPPINQTLITSPATTALLGEKNLNISRIIVRNICKRLQQPVIGFVDIKTNLPDAKLGKILVELLDDLYVQLENTGNE